MGKKGDTHEVSDMLVVEIERWLYGVKRIIEKLQVTFLR